MRLPSKVLVLGDDTRSFLAIVRSLARQGIEVHAGPFDFTSPALTSSMITRTHWLPYCFEDGSEWIEAVRALLARERFDLVVACDERTILALDRHRDQFSHLCKLAIPDREDIEVLFDKNNTRQLAQSVDVPVASGRLLRETDTAEDIIAEVGLPVVLKPRQSYSLDSLYMRSNAQILTDVEAVSQALSETSADRFIFESFFEGYGVGVSVLAREGRILQAFQHARVHESSVGGSSYRRSEALDPELEGAAERMLRRLRYSGLAMFEFRRRSDGSGFILLEVNARPWGSMPFPVALGVDFPFAWYRMLLHGVELPRASYRVGAHGRNVMQDYTFFRRRLSTLKHRPWQAARFAAGWLSGLTRVMTGHDCWDALVLDDPMPGLNELGGTVVSKAQRAMERMPGWRVVRRRRARARLAAALQEDRSGALVIFLCEGNICRSPFAALQLERFVDAYVHKPSFVSAGMLPLQDRSSPRIALHAAQERGVDMAAHRSRHLSRALAEKASVIIVFDDRNRQSVKARYPDLNTPVLSLCDFMDDYSSHAVDDPFGHGHAAFRAAYASITDGNRAIAGLLRSGWTNRVPH